jgi:hypothetical protein
MYCLATIPLARGMLVIPVNEVEKIMGKRGLRRWRKAT